MILIVRQGDYPNLPSNGEGDIGVVYAFKNEK